VRDPIHDDAASLTESVIGRHRNFYVCDNEVVTQRPYRGGSLSEGISRGGAPHVEPGGRVLVLAFEVKHGFAKWRLEVPRHVLIEDVLIPLERASNDFDIRLLIGDVHTLPGAAGGTPP
jgi:hypothetical protein